MSRADEALDDLIDGIRHRSEEAFSAVYRLTADGLASYAFGMLHDRPAAEDAVQQAFLELTRAARQRCGAEADRCGPGSTAASGTPA